MHFTAFLRLISIDCHELTVDEQLALAGAISEGLQGGGVAFVKDSSIVVDSAGEREVDLTGVHVIVERFISKRKDSKYYSVSTEGERITVHSADPLARSRGRKHPSMPENILQCPYCPFVTPYQEAYNVHVRSHGLIMGI